MAMHGHLRSVMLALLLLAAFVIPSVLITPFAHAQASVATVSVGKSPAAAAYGSAKGEVFVANSGDNAVSLTESAITSTTATSSSTAVVSSATTTTIVTNFLPPELAPYASIIGIVLLFVDGLLFGFAIKKAILSAVLIVVALVLAGFIGLAIPFLSASNVWTHILAILTSQIGHIGPLFYTFPIFWILGFALGFWKG